MVFGQLASRDSMLNLMLSLKAHQSKYDYLGFESTGTRKNHSRVNEKCSDKIIEEFSYVLIEGARKSCYKTNFEIDVDGNIDALDSNR